MVDENKGARSYKGQVIGDSMSLTINFKWLMQLIVGVAIIVYSFWTIESRIQELERNMVLALEEIELHEEERKIAEEKHIRDLEIQMQEQTDWIEKEFNINPFTLAKDLVIMSPCKKVNNEAVINQLEERAKTYARIYQDQ